MPGTFVEIVWNGPRISRGASGFGSHMSMWLGPPESQKRMTLVLGPVSPTGPAARARSRKRAGNDKPASPANPVWRNQRREPTRMRSHGAGQRLEIEGKAFMFYNDM